MRGVTLSYDPEYRHLGTNAILLEELAAMTGASFGAGVDELVEVTEEQAVMVYRPLWPLFVAAALLLFVADVALRRLDLAGWRLTGPPARYG